MSMDTVMLQTLCDEDWQCNQLTIRVGNSIMRSVLCFGDSNTYGQIPGEGPLDRYDTESRWPCVMQKALGAQWHVVEEGLSGRTTVSDDPIEGAFKNGRTYLRPCIQARRVFGISYI